MVISIPRVIEFREGKVQREEKLIGSFKKEHSKVTTAGRTWYLHRRTWVNGEQENKCSQNAITQFRCVVISIPRVIEFREGKKSLEAIISQLKRRKMSQRDNEKSDTRVPKGKIHVSSK